jgi:hypothetical protein
LALKECDLPLQASELLSSNPMTRRRALKRIASRLPFRPALRFGYAYFARLGFLDGRAGLRYAQLLAIYQHFIDLRVAELRAGRRA